MEGQFEHTESGIVADYAIFRDRGKGRVVCAARADDKLPNAAGSIEIPVIVLRPKPLIVVIVAAQHDIGTSVV